MDVTLDMFVGGVEPSTFVRTEPAKDTSSAGAFEALIAALSCVPVADVPPPPPPAVWSGMHGLPTPVVVDEIVPQVAPSNGEQPELAVPVATTPDAIEDIPVAVPVHAIPVVAMTLHTIAAVEPGREEAVALPVRQETSVAPEPTVAPLLERPAPLVRPAPLARPEPFAVPEPPALPVPLAETAPSSPPAPVAAPAEMAPSTAPSAASVVAASQVVTQVLRSQTTDADAHTPATPAVAEPAPTAPAPRTGVQQASTTVAPERAAAPGPRADVVHLTRHVPLEEPAIAASVPRPAVRPSVTLDLGGAPAPVPATPAAALAAPLTMAPGQTVEAASLAPVAPTGQAAAPHTRPTTEDGQPLESRLVEVMRWQAKEGGGRVEMKLRPEYLGAMTVTLQVEGGVVRASLAAESQATRDFLQAEAGHLKTALEDQGFTLETFEIRDDRDAPDDHPRQRPQQHPGSKRPGRSTGDAQAGETFDVIV